MQKCNHIKALFFLGIFSLLLMHQVVPHLHHQHEVEHTHKDVAHSEDHHHHAPEKESSNTGFLDLFLDMHVHSVVSSEILFTYESSLKQPKVKKNISKSFSVAHYYRFLENYDEVEKTTVYHPPNIYFNPYLSSLDLRGPPPLG